jgi:hypothetical protein
MDEVLELSLAEHLAEVSASPKGKALVRTSVPRMETAWVLHSARELEYEMGFESGTRSDPSMVLVKVSLTVSDWVQG